MAKYTLFISQMRSDPMDEGGLLVALKATTIEEARIEARGHFRDDEDIVVKAMSILEISSTEKIDMNALAAALEVERVAKEKVRREERERAELARLKSKFGG